MYTRTLLFFLHVHQFLLTWGLSTFVLIHCIGKVLYGPLGDRWSFQRTAWQLENLVILSATENNFPKGLGISFEVIFINCKCCYSKVHLDCNEFFFVWRCDSAIRTKTRNFRKEARQVLGFIGIGQVIFLPTGVGSFQSDWWSAGESFVCVC